MDSSLVLAATRRWIDTVVLRHGLCPFAGSVVSSGRLHIVISKATSAEQLVDDFIAELLGLAHADRDKRETSLLIHPYVLTDFEAYNDFLDIVDATLIEAGMHGVIQVASFHPDYCFAGEVADDPANFSNRSPYPMLHLLREESINEAVQSWSGQGRSVEQIPQANTEILRKMGVQLLRAQLAACKETAISKNDQ